MSEKPGIIYVPESKNNIEVVIQDIIGNLELNVKGAIREQNYGNVPYQYFNLGYYSIGNINVWPTEGEKGEILSRVIDYFTEKGFQFHVERVWNHSYFMRPEFTFRERELV